MRDSIARTTRYIVILIKCNESNVSLDSSIPLRSTQNDTEGTLSVYESRIAGRSGDRPLQVARSLMHLRRGGVAPPVYNPRTVGVNFDASP